MSDRWVCRRCQLVPGLDCGCTGPIHVVAAITPPKRTLSEWEAIHHERHSLTERDKEFLRSAGLKW